MTNTCSLAQTSLLHGDMESLLNREWLITNTLGSYASSTVLNCNTRRYHGMLVSSNIPPLGRVLTVNNFLERLIIDGREYQMSNFEFNGAIHPKGFELQTSFHRHVDEDISSVSFVYDVDGVTFMRTLWLLANHNTVLVHWLAADTTGMRHIELAVHPLVAMRDFHSLRRQSTSNIFKPQQVGNALHLDVPAFRPDQENEFYGINLIPTGLRGPTEAEFHPQEDWWYNFLYRVEAARGQDCGEDLYLPGFFNLRAKGKVSYGLWLDTEGLSEKELDRELTKINVHLQAGQGPLSITDEVSSKLAPSIESSSDNPLREPVEVTLRKAASQFIVRRKDLKSKDRWTILAGFPWFGDWGRDAFIALPGLLLSTGRYEQAKAVLQLFGSAERDGLIPNRFDDYGGEPHYNTVDASLWYIIAADEYLKTSNDNDSWKKFLQKTCLSIVENYAKGTQFNIHMDEADGLIWAGDQDTQLTWMDARCNNISFTPRWGKPVEINALWYNALKIVASRLDGRKKKKAEMLNKLAEKVEASFQKKFWNEDEKYLYDCVRDDFSDPALRPNQIFAVSLPYSPLELYQQKAVVECVKNNLLTPMGLRSLSPDDPNYCGIYAGDAFSRDSAYHQGTVWGWLMGPFIEAYLKVNNSPEHAQIAKEYLKPMLDNLYQSGIGTINEIFNGNSPHKPHGCFAQAWSVAQVIQAHLAIEQYFAGDKIKERATLKV